VIWLNRTRAPPSVSSSGRAGAQAEALRIAKRHNAPIIVAKLDRLSRDVLGIVDAQGYPGIPGAYFDNAESFTAIFSVSSAVPEPSTWAMVILGFCGLGFMAYRKKAAVRFARSRFRLSKSRLVAYRKRTTVRCV
jgi:hypothetical protein